jgi:hypothetical protein
MLDRGDYRQIAFVIAGDGGDVARAGLDHFRQSRPGRTRARSRGRYTDREGDCSPRADPATTWQARLLAIR